VDVGDGLRVLIVEDEWLIAESLANQLIEHSSVVVGPASGVEAALELVSTRPIDWAVLDVSLGEENSFPVADQLQQRGIPFIFVTGYAACDLPQRFKNRPLLVKPVDTEVLRGVRAELITGHSAR
jgi:CheY-like chemotaxis protein